MHLVNSAALCCGFLLMIAASGPTIAQQRKLDCPAPPQQIARDVSVDTKRQSRRAG
jgi:hypothetical protein